MRGFGARVLTTLFELAIAALLLVACYATVSLILDWIRELTR